MTKKVSSIRSLSNLADQPRGTLEGVVLPPETPPLPAGEFIRMVILALHEIGMQNGQPHLRMIALKAALELRGLRDQFQSTSHTNSKEFKNA